MEEDVRKIELAIIKAEYYNLDITTDIIEIKTLKNVLNELERLKKENEELKEHMKNREHNYTVAIREQIENSIPKEKIKSKLEKLASLEHERWSKWQKYVHDLCIKNGDGSLTIPKERVERWNYEIETEYKDLPEHLKEYDREEIRIFLKELLEEEK